MKDRLRRLASLARRAWESPFTGVALVVVILAVIACWLLACSGGGISLPWGNRTPSAPAAPSDPFAGLWWIPVAGVAGGIGMIALLGMRREGFITIAASIGLAILLNWLKSNMTLVLIGGGVAAAAYVFGNGQERLSALRGAIKLHREGRTAEAEALRRQAFPWIDAKYRRESKARRKSGSIKPVAKGGE